MREIEIKIINIDINAFRSKIINLGAKQFFAGDVCSIVLDYKDMRLSKKDSMLRLRYFIKKTKKREKVCELTFKGQQEKGSYKVRKEINLVMPEYNDSLQLLKALGLKTIKKIFKFRESYTLTIKKNNKNIKYYIDIDDYKIIPEFAEIEAKNIENIKYILKLLKIPKKSLYNGSTQDILKLYGIKQKY